MITTSRPPADEIEVDKSNPLPKGYSALLATWWQLYENWA
jgi:hypothetical protein